MFNEFVLLVSERAISISLFLLAFWICYLITFIVATKTDNNTKPMSNKEYNSRCRKVGFLKYLPFIMAVIAFIFLCFVETTSDAWLSAFFMMFATGWISLICASVGSDYLVKLASRRGVPKDNPNIAYQAKEHVMGTAALIGGAASTAKNIKKNADKLMNVDNWDKMK